MSRFRGEVPMSPEELGEIKKKAAEEPQLTHAEKGLKDIEQHMKKAKGKTPEEILQEMKEDAEKFVGTN